MKLTEILRSRRGISLTEVVVSMTAVIIITGAAVSVLVASSAADVKFAAKTYVLAGCENAVDCLRFADGDGNILKDALGKAGFTEDTEKNEYVLSYADETVTVSVEKDGENENYVVKYNDEIIYETENAEE